MFFCISELRDLPQELRGFRGFVRGIPKGPKDPIIRYSGLG